MIYYLCPMYRVILSQRGTVAVPHNGTPAIPFLVFVSAINTHRAVLGPAIWPLGLFARKHSGFHCAGRLLCCAARESPCIISRFYISIFCPPCIWWMQWEVNYGGGIFYLVELREMVLFSRERYYTKRKATNKV